jgi:hypothetical protein
MAWDRTKWKAFKELVIKVKKLLANWANINVSRKIVH